MILSANRTLRLIRIKLVLFLLRVSRKSPNIEAKISSQLEEFFPERGSYKGLSEVEESFFYDRGLRLNSQMSLLIKRLKTLPAEELDFEKTQFVLLMNKLVDDPFFLASLPYRNFHSFSQEGEDLFISDLFPKDYVGFYVDIGAHHPFRFSNTALLSAKGWRGLNIDPIKDLSKIFKTYRPADKTLEVGISLEAKRLPYFQFDDEALNTFNPERAQFLQETTHYKLVSRNEIVLLRLDQILRENLDDKQKIDLLTIDVEGFELSVLNSNDWNEFRPQVILIEILQTEQLRESGSEAINILLNLGYVERARTLRNYVFIDGRNF